VGVCIPFLFFKLNLLTSFFFLCVCICVCMCVYTCMCVFLYIYIHTNNNPQREALELTSLLTSPSPIHTNCLTVITDHIACIGNDNGYIYIQSLINPYPKKLLLSHEKSNLFFFSFIFSVSLSFFSLIFCIFFSFYVFFSLSISGYL
jgi:hypothetical protein